MSDMTYENEPSAAVLADAVRRAAAAEQIVGLLDGYDSVIAQVVSDDATLVVQDLEHLDPAPRRPRGTALLHDPFDFAAYVNRVATTYTTLWADQTTRRVTAVVNDHDESQQGWRDHTVVLELQVDPEWAAWSKLDGQLVGQVAMAEHLEEYGPNVVDPDGATMLEIAQSIRGSKTCTFESSTRLRTGDIELTYREETKAKAGAAGKLEIPEVFTIRVAPYLGHDPVDMRVRLRFRISDEGKLTLGYRLIRPDLVLREAFEVVRGRIVDAIADGVPVLLGAAPAARAR